MLVSLQPWIFFQVTLLILSYQISCHAFWFFSCRHGNGHGLSGDDCSVFCKCHAPNTCEAGIQKCAAPAKYGMRCHATKPCANGLSCHPGIQKCFHIPRQLSEPCVAGHECASGLTCEPGMQVGLLVKLTFTGIKYKRKEMRAHCQWCKLHTPISRLRFATIASGVTTSHAWRDLSVAQALAANQEYKDVYITHGGKTNVARQDLSARTAWAVQCVAGKPILRVSWCGFLS